MPHRLSVIKTTPNDITTTKIRSVKNILTDVLYNKMTDKRNVTPSFFYN